MISSRPQARRRSRLVLVLVLFAALQLGCSCGGGAVPVAKALIPVLVWVGKLAAETVVIESMKAVFDRIFGASRPEDPAIDVTVDPENPLRGRCQGPVKIQKKDDPSKEVLLVDFPVQRASENDKWTIDPTYLSKIENTIR